MASVVGPTTPVWVIELDADGDVLTAFAPVGQGSGDVAWFGRETPAAYERLMLLREAVAPVLSAAVPTADRSTCCRLAAQAVAMGDDVHVRTQAATNLLLRHLLPSLMGTGHPRAGDVGRYLSANHLLFLTLAMASARTLTAWAGQVDGVLGGHHDGAQRHAVRREAVGKPAVVPRPGPDGRARALPPGSRGSRRSSGHRRQRPARAGRARRCRRRRIARRRTSWSGAWAKRPR